MQRVAERVTAADPLSPWVPYADLARAVYGGSDPTRPQLSAISRAVRRLEARGQVLRARDWRVTAAAAQRPYALLRAVSKHFRYEMTVDQLARQVWQTDTPSDAQLGQTEDAYLLLCSHGHLGPLVAPEVAIAAERQQRVRAAEELVREAMELVGYAIVERIMDGFVRDGEPGTRTTDPFGAPFSSTSSDTAR